MVEENRAEQARLEKIYKKVKALYGEVPPQVYFLGAIGADYLEAFVKNVAYIARHPAIKPDLFAFIRLHIAYREGYPFCSIFNRALLKKRGYDDKACEAAIADIEAVPFDAKHRQLARFAIKAMYDSTSCHSADFTRLYEMGWRQRDVFDAVEHAGTILRNGRILTAYMEKS